MPKPEDRIQWLIRKGLPKRHRNRGLDAWKFATAENVVVSYPKCGRTWLRAALTFYFAERYGIADPPLLEYANLHYLDGRIPRIFFTHDEIYYGRAQRLTRDKTRYARKRVLLLVRDPRDAAVSLYFHRAKRERDLDVPLYEYMVGPERGLDQAIEFMNIWADALRDLPNVHSFSYEVMHTDGAKCLAEALRFFGEEPQLEAVEVAMDRARFDRLRALEVRGSLRSGRLKAVDPDDPDSFKVRRGKVGGYIDYFDELERAELDRVVQRSLSPFYGPILAGR